MPPYPHDACADTSSTPHAAPNPLQKTLMLGLIESKYGEALSDALRYAVYVACNSQMIFQCSFVHFGASQ